MDQAASPAPFLTRQVLFMGIIYSMGGFLYGYDTGQISGFLEMDNFKKRFGVFDPETSTHAFPTTRSGVVVAIFSIGSCVGSVCAGFLADRVGRKPPVLLFCSVYLVGALIQITSSTHWYQLVIGRCIGGIGVGGLSTLTPLAANETAPANTRGFIVTLYSLSITIAILVASVINLGTERIQSSASWRITMGLDFLWGSLLMIGTLFLPETPKYVFSKGDPARAKASMARMLGVDEQHPVLQNEMKEMQDKLNTEQHATIGGKDKPWWSVFQSKEVCLRTLLAAGIMSFNQLTGANFFFYYGTTIFTTTGISNGYVIQVIISAVNVVSTVPGLYFAQRLSHRKCLFVGALWMAACFLVFSSVGQFSLDKTDPTRTPAAEGIMITATVLFIAAFASTWSPLSWGEASLVCPAHCRATCASVATACLWIWGFLLAFFTPVIIASISYLYGYVFSVCCVLMAIMVYYFLIESRGRTIEEVDQLYDKLVSKSE